MKEVAEYVQNSEPTTLKYQILVQKNKKTGVDEIVVLERSVSSLKQNHLIWTMTYKNVIIDERTQLQEQSSDRNPRLLETIPSIREEDAGGEAGG